MICWLAVFRIIYCMLGFPFDKRHHIPATTIYVFFEQPSFQERGNLNLLYPAVHIYIYVYIFTLPSIFMSCKWNYAHRYFVSFLLECKIWMSKFSTVINFVASYLNAEIPFLLLMFCIIGSRNTILNLPVHVFIWPWKWCGNCKFIFIYKGLSLAGGNEFMVILCADFEKCIHVIDELIHASH